MPMTEQKRVLLPVRRWKQLPNECAICSVASIANYYDSNITYSSVRRLILKRERQKGLYTPQQGKLLNDLGFKDVTIVTFDLDIFDFSWNRLSREGLLRRLRRAKSYHARTSGSGADEVVREYIEWLECEDCNNRIIIDNDLPKYIRKYLDHGRPVGASYNSTTLWKESKGSMASDQDIKGDTLEHAVVIRGYDDYGLFIVDSDKPTGFYKLKWSKFLVSVKTGDLLLVK